MKRGLFGLRDKKMSKKDRENDWMWYEDIG